MGSVLRKIKKVGSLDVTTTIVVLTQMMTIGPHGHHQSVSQKTIGSINTAMTVLGTELKRRDA